MKSTTQEGDYREIWKETLVHCQCLYYNVKLYDIKKKGQNVACLLE